MATEIRYLHAGEMDQFGLLGAYVFAGSFGHGPDNYITQNNRVEWTLGAFVNGRLVSSHAAIPFTMRANGNAVAIGGVTAVGTLPEYRRQGHLRQLTQRAFCDLREQERGVAMLWASQAAIYQRYGYAQATSSIAYRVDTVDIGFHDAVEGGCRVERMDGAAAFDVAKQVYLDFVRDGTCYLHRAKVLWSNGVLARSDEAGPAHVAVARDQAGKPMGYVIYHLRGGRTGHRTRGQEIVIKDLAWLTVDAYRSLWSWLKRHDLVGSVHWPRAPRDDPAPELFIEPRLLNVQLGDGVWLRVVDVAVALGGRGYDVEDAITIDVAPDALAPWNGGRFRLQCAPEGTRVSGTSAAADLRLGIKALASLYCGARTPRELRGFGLLAADDRALARAERIFVTRQAPHCPDSF